MLVSLVGRANNFRQLAFLHLPDDANDMKGTNQSEPGIAHKQTGRFIFLAWSFNEKTFLATKKDVFWMFTSRGIKIHNLFIVTLFARICKRTTRFAWRKTPCPQVVKLRRAPNRTCHF
jgi:hypothetical protein